MYVQLCGPFLEWAVEVLSKVTVQIRKVGIFTWRSTWIPGCPLCFRAVSNSSDLAPMRVFMTSNLLADFFVPISKLFGKWWSSAIWHVQRVCQLHGRLSYTVCVIRAFNTDSIWAKVVWRSSVEVVGGPG